MIRAPRFFLFLVAAASLGFASAASAQEINFVGYSAYHSKTKAEAIAVSVDFDGIENLSFDYPSESLLVSFALCNQPYTPETAYKTRCIRIATQELPALEARSGYYDLSFASKGFRKVKAGTYRAVLFLSDRSFSGIYSWGTFPRAIKIKKK